MYGYTILIHPNISMIYKRYNFNKIILIRILSITYYKCKQKNAQNIAYG